MPMSVFVHISLQSVTSNLIKMGLRDSYLNLLFVVLRNSLNSHFIAGVSDSAFSPRNKDFHMYAFLFQCLAQR